MMMDYCEVCEKEVETKVIMRKETFNVCGEDIEVNAQIMVCADCGEELFNEELDSKTLVCAYNEYRRKHTKLLNWGDKTIHRYENGAIQDRVHNSLLLFLREPENMRTYLLENEVTIDEKQKARLLETVERLEQTTEYRTGRRFFELLSSSIPSEENGFKSFDYDKFCAMVLFFAHKNVELLKTKLMKLLNYSDMIFYKENGISISGLKYAHLPYGPVPDHFEMLLGKMAEDHIAHINILYDGAYEKHQVIPEQDIPEGGLTDLELNVLERVYEKFKDFGSSDISDYSHKEKGYQSTKEGEIISYTYAKDIKLN